MEPPGLSAGTCSPGLAAGHDVTVFVRTPSKLPPEVSGRVSVHTGDLDTHVPGDLIEGHDALINCAGHVAGGETFVALVDRVVTAVDSVPVSQQPVCWFLAGAALLDLDTSGRRGVDLPKVKSTYWPHPLNFERLGRSRLDWRMLCPGPMVDEPALGIDRLRISIDAVPVPVPAYARAVPAALVVPVFASLIPQMIVPYADAAALMLANLNSGNAMSRRRVGLALPLGMRGRKPHQVPDRMTRRVNSRFRLFEGGTARECVNDRASRDRHRAFKVAVPLRGSRAADIGAVRAHRGARSVARRQPIRPHGLDGSRRVCERGHHRHRPERGRLPVACDA